MANGLTNFLAEARRRRVFRTAGVYLVAVWGLSQGAVELAPLFDAPNWLVRSLVIALLALLPVVVVLAWMFDIGRGGIARDPHDVAARPDLDRDIANMSTMIGGDLGPGAVIVRWNGIGGENAVIFLKEFFLGRADQCRVRFYDPLVSRKHARIFCEDNAWWIEDLGSRNGTLVDEKQVARSILPKECEIRVNEAGPVLRLELVPPGPQMRLAMSATSTGEIVAHVRNASSDFQPKQDSDVTKE